MRNQARKSSLTVANIIVLTVGVVLTPGCITDRTVHDTRASNAPDRYRIEQVVVDGHLQFGVCANCPEITEKVRAKRIGDSWVESAYRTRVRAMAAEVEQSLDPVPALETAANPLSSSTMVEVEQIPPAPASEIIAASMPAAVQKDAPPSMEASAEPNLMVAQTAAPHTSVATPAKFEVHFAFARQEPESSSLDPVEDFLRADKRSRQVTIRGFTDSIGPKRYNDALAYSRAEEVRRELQRRGLVAKYEVSGEGICCYIAPNDTAEGRARNRRAEIEIRDDMMHVAGRNGT